MKVFGIQIGNVTQESTEKSILNLISQLKSIHHVPRRLNALCLTNSDIVVSLVFGSKLDKDVRGRLLFLYSKDHTGSCGLSDNPRWVIMMRELIIPRMTELPDDFRCLIRWYQNVHGL